MNAIKFILIGVGLLAFLIVGSCTYMGASLFHAAEAVAKDPEFKAALKEGAEKAREDREDREYYRRDVSYDNRDYDNVNDADFEFGDPSVETR